MKQITAPVLALILTLSLPVYARRSASTSSDKHAAAHETAPAPKPEITPVTFTTVVIDAGHGGHDPGGIPSNIIPEKGVALDVALKLSARLKNYGLKTVLTRSDDTFISLGERMEIANKERDAIFVSIHFNSADRAEARGIETYFSAAVAQPLAARIHQRVISTTTGENRGVKTANYYVLRKAQIPAVLVECGFLTNKEDVALAQTDTYRQGLAEQIAEAIVEYQEANMPASTPLADASSVKRASH